MRFLRALCLVCLVLTTQCSRSSLSTAYDAAGIIAYTRIQERTYVLLSDHVDSDRGWGTFGGHREAGESLEMTAGREFREETRCVYDTPSIAELEDAPVVAQRHFLSYILEIPYVPVQVFESRTLPDDCRDESFFERGPYAWVLIDDVIRTIESVDSAGVYTLPRACVPATAPTLKLWNESATILQKAIEQGYLK